MNQLLSWGLAIVRDTQSLASPALTSAAKGVSLLGTEFCYLALLPLIYWCVDKRRGLRIGALVLLTSVVNLRLKLAFAQPRPYDLDPSVALAREATFGLPSNHAMVSVVFWGSAARLFRSSLGLILAIALPLLIGLSARVPRRPFPHRRPRWLDHRSGHARTRPPLRRSDRALGGGIAREHRPRPGRGCRARDGECPLHQGHFAIWGVFRPRRRGDLRAKGGSVLGFRHVHQAVVAIFLRVGYRRHHLCAAEVPPRRRRVGRASNLSAFFAMPS